jgi:hypothetical protein
MQFRGRYVETGRAYSYTALRTLNGSKIALPTWINGEAIAKFKNNIAVFDARIETLACTDMSSACLTGRLIDILSVQITFASPVEKGETIKGNPYEYQ